MGATLPLFRALLCLLCYLCLDVIAQEPEVAYTKFSRRNMQLHLFANSSSALYVDSWVNGTIHVTQDNGKTWKEADLPSGAHKEVTLHPFDNRYAFVETNEGPFFRTSDRGLTWQPFEVPFSRSYVMEHFSFHSGSDSSTYILISGSRCVSSERTGQRCYTDYYYTRDAFSSQPTLLLKNANSCRFAHSSKDFVHKQSHDLILCEVSDWSEQSIFSSKLLASSDFFNNDKRVVDLGKDWNKHNVFGLKFVGKFAFVSASTDSSQGRSTYTLSSSDLNRWSRVSFSKLEEGSSSHSLEALTSSKLTTMDTKLGNSGLLYVSDSNGTNFVESLKNVEERWWHQGFKYDKFDGVAHVGIVNVVMNPEERNTNDRILRSRVSYDDGSSWHRLTPSLEDASAATVPCDPSNEEDCSLHLHKIGKSFDDFYDRPGKAQVMTTSPAPGLIIRVGSIGPNLQPYEECDTFLSTDGGLNWRLVAKGPSLFEYADEGSLIVLVKDVGDTDEVLCSKDSGRSWHAFPLEYKLQPSRLKVAAEPFSQKFMLSGRIAHEDDDKSGRYSGEVLFVYLDFGPLRGRKCQEDDFERWYLRDNASNGCILGHKEWYLRRKMDTDCYVGNGPDLTSTVFGEEGICTCEREDYECDYNYVRQGHSCVPAVSESIPPGACTGASQSYLGPSGYRLKAGNTCTKHNGVVLDSPVWKDCAPPQLPEGEVQHKAFDFPVEVVQSEYLKESTTMLVRLRDGSMWQSSNEGYTWTQLVADERILTFVTHPYSPDRGYLLTKTKTYFYTTDAGRTWNRMDAPLPPNTFGSATLAFNPRVDYLIWVGDIGCSGSETVNECHAEAYYSLDHGRTWKLMDSYVRHCEWARDERLLRDFTQVVCESYKEKSGNQRYFGVTNPLQLVSGTQFYKEKRVLVQRVVGFVRLAEYLLVAEYHPHTQSLGLRVSRDGVTFSEAVFPIESHPQNHAYTILDTSSMSTFVHLTTSEYPNPIWGLVLKSGSDGIVYVKTLDYVNRDERGYVDFVKLPVLNGIALANVIADPEDSIVTGRKELLTRITHNDGGIWRPLTTPKKDSMEQEYFCSTENCSLHLHTFSARPNSRSALDVPSRPELLISVGNVGETLAPYEECATFLSRDAGLTWSEIRKSTHVWAFGDRGSLLVMARDSVPIDRVIYSTDEGLTWNEYRFKGQEKIRVRSIVTVSHDSSRRFILFGHYPQSMDASVAIHLDFSFLTKKQCIVNQDNPAEGDFELWAPTDEGHERCLFGRQTLYERRIRDRNCYIGDQTLRGEAVVMNCECTAADFECEFNHVRDESGICVLVPGTTPLVNDTYCTSGQKSWFERTAYRKIGYSTCEGGVRLDQGVEHNCTDDNRNDEKRITKHGWLFWSTIVYLSVALAVLFGYVMFRCSGLARGKIRLMEGDVTESGPKTNVMKTLAAPFVFVGGLVVRTARRVSHFLPFRSRNRTASDEDAHLLSLGG